MRKVLPVFFSVFLLVITSSWHLEIHLCQNQIEGIALGHQELSCNNQGSCGDCCDNVHLEYFADFDYSVHQLWQLPAIDCFVVQSEINFECLVHEGEQEYSVSNSKAPPTKERLFLKFQQLIFYS